MEVSHAQMLAVDGRIEEKSKAFHEWHFTLASQYQMVAKFGDLIPDVDLQRYQRRDHGGVIDLMEEIAIRSRKCCELHSDPVLLTKQRRRYGQNCVLYATGDVVFVTVPGSNPGQKMVEAVHSLSERLADKDRRAVMTGNSRRAKEVRKVFRGGRMVVQQIGRPVHSWGRG
jgi:hypothetical protein